VSGIAGTVGHKQDWLESQVSVIYCSSRI